MGVCGCASCSYDGHAGCKGAALRWHTRRRSADGGQCRAIWNLFLAANVDRYKAEGKFVFYSEMSAQLPKLTKEDPRLVGLPHRAAQMTVQKLDRALRDCAKSKRAARRGFPRFKKYTDRADAFSIAGREVRVEPGRIRLPKVAGCGCAA